MKHFLILILILGYSISPLDAEDEDRDTDGLHGSYTYFDSSHRPVMHFIPDGNGGYVGERMTDEGIERRRFIPDLNGGYIIIEQIPTGDKSWRIVPNVLGGYSAMYEGEVKEILTPLRDGRYVNKDPEGNIIGYLEPDE